jgi:hypothetical protein
MMQIAQHRGKREHLQVMARAACAYCAWTCSTFQDLFQLEVTI